MYPRWPTYTSVAERRRKAKLATAKLAKKGQSTSPVVIEAGRNSIARTFWGKAWCKNLESYSDYSNRLPRGRSYVRNGSVVDLQIAPGEVRALVSGSSMYRVRVGISPVPKARWKAICKDCAGAIDSLVELLQGKFSKGVMERMCRQKAGLFPSPAEIQVSCSCPDSAVVCKHVAAVFYGIGARLDHAPRLLFELRQVAEKDLIASAGAGLAVEKKGAGDSRILRDSAALSEMFGLELASDAPADAKAKAPARRRERTPPASRRRPAKSPAATKVSSRERRTNARPTAKGRKSRPVR